MTKVVFPSFREQEYSQFEMRQLVSALELRFQSIETEIQQSVIPDTDPVGGEFAPLVHTHVEADITDLDHTSSIFELDDVNGTPSLNDILVWDGGQFLPQAAGGVTLMLNDLTDVNAPGPADEQVLTFDIGTLRWIAADPPAGNQRRAAQPAARGHGPRPAGPAVVPAAERAQDLQLQP